MVRTQLDRDAQSSRCVRGRERETKCGHELTSLVSLEFNGLVTGLWFARCSLLAT